MTNTALAPLAGMSRHRWLLIVPVVLLSLAAAVRSATAKEVNRVVLRVNDRIATLYDYESMKEERLAALSRAQIPEAERQRQTAGVGVSVMKELFDEMLVLSRADQLNVRLEQGEIEQAVEQMKASFGITSEADFEKALVDNGMTRESFRAQVEKNLLIRQVMGREVYSQVEVEEEDLRRYYQQNTDTFRIPAMRLLREVVVLEEGSAAADLESRAEEVRNALLSDERDAAIAASEAEGVTTGWIDLGWVEVGDLDPQLEEALVNLGPGDVSRPTPARGGLHVMQVVDAREAGVREFREVSAEIEARLTDERFREALGGYMKDLEAAAYIESDPPPEAAGFRSGRAAERARVDRLEPAFPEASRDMDDVPSQEIDDPDSGDSVSDG